MKAFAFSSSLRYHPLVVPTRALSKHINPSLRNPTFNPLRAMSATTRREDPFKPAARVAGQKQDVWYVLYT